MGSFAMLSRPAKVGQHRTVDVASGFGQEQPSIEPTAMTATIPTQICALLEQGDCCGSISPDLISDVERRNGFEFPDEYRAFLLRYGAALLSGLEVFGLVPSYGDGEPPVWNDLRPLLVRRRDELPVDWVPISDDGGDFRFYLSCAMGPDRGRIFVNGPGADAVLVSSGFFDFLERATSLGIRRLIPA